MNKKNFSFPDNFILLIELILEMENNVKFDLPQNPES